MTSLRLQVEGVLQAHGIHSHSCVEGCAHTHGMSLRDYFATHATDEDVSMAAQAYMAKFGKEVCSVADARYFHADAMLTAREGR